jgi:tRNA (guanine37-N1)-methyltransferase
MHFNIFTLFPEMFGCYFGASILERAQAMGLVGLAVHNIRDFAHDRHHVTDEPPYGGGGGMILKPEPIFRAVEAVTGDDPARRGPVILLAPQGRQFTQRVAEELAGNEQLNLIAGRYEGVDERVRAHLVTDELSIGDYVLTGGELAAMVVIDAVVRLLPGALGAEGAAESDSYATGLLEGPHYTRPGLFRGWEAPTVLRSGHAANIARWRREQALRRTWERRPELLLTAPLGEEDRFFLGTLAEESAGARS